MKLSNIIVSFAIEVFLLVKLCGISAAEKVVLKNYSTNECILVQPGTSSVVESNVTLKQCSWSNIPEGMKIDIHPIDNDYADSTTVTMESVYIIRNKGTNCIITGTDNVDASLKIGKCNSRHAQYTINTIADVIKDVIRIQQPKGKCLTVEADRKVRFETCDLSKETQLWTTCSLTGKCSVYSFLTWTQPITSVTIKEETVAATVNLGDILVETTQTEWKQDSPSSSTNISVSQAETNLIDNSTRECTSTMTTSDSSLKRFCLAQWFNIVVLFFLRNYLLI